MRLRIWGTAALLFAVMAAPAAAQTTVTVVNEGINIRPALAYNGTADLFLVVWSNMPTAAKWARADVEGALLSTGAVVTVESRFAISRPNGKKIYSPFIAATWHPELQLYCILWHESLGDTGSLMLTTLDAGAAVVKRGTPVADAPGVLVAAPTVWNASPLLQAAAWSEMRADGFHESMLLIDPVKPNTSSYLPQAITTSTTLVEIPQAAVPGSTGEATLYGLYLNSTSGVNRSLFVRTVKPFAAGIGFREVATTRKLRESQTVSAAGSDDGQLVLYDKHNSKKEVSGLAVFPFKQGDPRAGNPAVLTTEGTESRQGVILPPAGDGLHRLVWIGHGGDKYSVNVQALTSLGELTGSTQTVYSSKHPLAFPAAAYGHEGQYLMIVWSEDIASGVVRLSAAQIAIP